MAAARCASNRPREQNPAYPLLRRFFLSCFRSQPSCRPSNAALSPEMKSLPIQVTDIDSVVGSIGEYAELDEIVQ